MPPSVQPNSPPAPAPKRIVASTTNSNPPFKKGENVFYWALERWSDASPASENRAEAKKRIDDAWWYDYRKEAKLDLAGLNLKSLPNCLISVNNVSELNLVGNPLEQLPDLREMTGLQKILVTAEIKERLEKLPLLLPLGCSLICA